MSTTRYERDGLILTTFAGPPGCNEHAGGRACVQITSHSLNGYSQWMAMTMDHWIDLVCYIRELDRLGLGITNAPEV